MNSLKFVAEFCPINGLYRILTADLLPLLPLSIPRNFPPCSSSSTQMAESLQDAIRSMSLKDDDPIDLPDNPCFQVFEQNALSILGRLLNPSCQPMAEMIETMPKIWRVYDRVRGIALSSEKFQFVFKREDDMETVLKDRPWSFNYWTMLIDRWIPSPPKNFLSTVDVWVRIHHIPMNYYTLDTMDFLARKIGKVIEIAYDPNVSQKDAFIRAQVRLDIANPATARRVLNIPSGGQVMIEFEYEKLRKRCFHCLRLTHERPDCPMLRIKSPRAEASVNSSKEKVVNTVIARGQQELGVYLSVPPGFEPLFPELPPEERAMAMQYIAHSDPTERQARIVRVQQSILTEGVPERVDMSNAIK